MASTRSLQLALELGYLGFLLGQNVGPMSGLTKGQRAGVAAA